MSPFYITPNMYFLSSLSLSLLATGSARAGPGYNTPHQQRQFRVGNGNSFESQAVPPMITLLLVEVQLAMLAMPFAWPRIRRTVFAIVETGGFYENRKWKPKCCTWLGIRKPSSQKPLESSTRLELH
jgi:hypothetical protein